MNAGPGHYAVISAIVFAIGLYGVMARRNALQLLLAVGVLFTAPVIALVGFAQTGQGGVTPPLGNVMAVFAVVAMASELIIGLALVMLLWRRTGSADVDDLIDVEG